MNERLKKVISYIKMEFNLKSQAKVAEFLGYNASYLSDLLNGRYDLSEDITDRITDRIPAINKVWLKTGEGQMLSVTDEQRHKATSSEMLEAEGVKYRLIPVYNLDAVGGNGHNEVVDVQEYKIGMMPFIDAKEGDICVPISGHSMYPLYPAGSYVQIREVKSWFDYLEIGNVYIIVLKDGRRLIKEVRESEVDRSNYYSLHSYNPNFTPQELPKKLISKLFLVIAKCSREVM